MPDWLPEVLAAVFATIIAITFHEAAHGYAAEALGDPTARERGRVTLNPIKHVDPIGTVVLPGILLIGQLLTIGRVEAMIGWAKPVPVDFMRLRNPRWGMLWVAAAGPAMNVLLAYVAALSAHLAGFADPPTATIIYRAVALFMIVNLVLAAFNMLPIPPLDGGRIVTALLPWRLALPFARTERYGLLIVIGLIVVAPRVFPGFDPMDWLLANMVSPIFNLVLRAAGQG
ncbi:site-2 protease family protein [Rhodovarius crocodyli]|uniref:Site-2 protease family protein n=1 Tax=Rhodovarius crocodyli TaxID=1979269 RepID=A0A437MIC7_9PROT|nr:site-2 protease family protein [Rhodovarius crocodyli]RVT97391.1 site-2 protease family protein [Rhodovarius crocodyli]